MKTPYQQYYSNSYKSRNNNGVHAAGVGAIRTKLPAIPYRPKAKVFDIACGTGMLGLTFSKNVFGIDLNPEAVRVAKKNGVHARLGNVEKPWKAQTNSFDIVLASHIIEHVVDTDLMVRQSKQLLKRGGLFIVVTPNLAAWFNRLILLCGMQPMFTEVSTKDKTLGQQFLRRFAKHKSPVGHLRIFTPSALKELLALHGFETIQISGVEFGAFPGFLRILDRLCAHIPSLAASTIVVGRKI